MSDFCFTSAFFGLISFAVDASNAGTIVVEFRRIKDVQRVLEPLKKARRAKAPSILVNEANKNNMIFQSLSVVPDFAPSEVYDYEYADPGAALFKDEALPNGELRVLYRTDYWMRAATFINPNFVTMDVTADDDAVHVTETKRPPPPPIRHSKLVRYINKLDTALTKHSKIREFFEALGHYDPMHPWSASDVRGIVDALRQDFVDTAQQLKDIEDPEWHRTYLRSFPEKERERNWLIIQEAIAWVVDGRHFISLA